MLLPQLQITGGLPRAILAKPMSRIGFFDTAPPLNNEDAFLPYRTSLQIMFAIRAR
jgi:hypothetical protein